jgi:hypothetical protein
LITTNSLPQTFNRRVVAAHLEAKNPLSLTFAIPDHPWYLGGDMAAVRIAMTVGVAGKRDGQLVRVVDSQRQATRGGDELRPPRSGPILSNLTVGIDLDEAKPLRAGEEICGLGVALHGSGFILTSSEATRLAKSGQAVIKPYVNGRDLLHRPKPKSLIDFSFLSESEARSTNPAAFQHVVLHVKPERDENQRDQIRRLWWRFGWERPVLRGALKSLRRFIATTETAKHRTFQFIRNDVLPDRMVICIALDDAFFLGVLSSRVHVTWTLAAGGTLENPEQA